MGALSFLSSRPEEHRGASRSSSAQPLCCCNSLFFFWHCSMAGSSSAEQQSRGQQNMNIDERRESDIAAAVEGRCSTVAARLKRWAAYPAAAGRYPTIRFQSSCLADNTAAPSIHNHDPLPPRTPRGRVRGGVPHAPAAICNPCIRYSDQPN